MLFAGNFYNCGLCLLFSFFFFCNLKRGCVSDPQYFALNKGVLLLAPLQTAKDAGRILASGNSLNV